MNTMDKRSFVRHCAIALAALTGGAGMAAFASSGGPAQGASNANNACCCCPECCPDWEACCPGGVCPPDQKSEQ